MTQTVMGQCIVCGADLTAKRFGAMTCGGRCRTAKYRAEAEQRRLEALKKVKKRPRKTAAKK